MLLVSKISVRYLFVVAELNCTWCGIFSLLARVSLLYVNFLHFGNLKSPKPSLTASHLLVSFPILTYAGQSSHRKSSQSTIESHNNSSKNLIDASLGE
jgi:hypothetical protein